MTRGKRDFWWYSDEFCCTKTLLLNALITSRLPQSSVVSLSTNTLHFTIWAVMKLEKLGLQGKSCALLLKPTLLKGSALTLKATGILSLFVLHFWLFHYHSMSSCWMFAAKSAICNSRRHVLLNAFYSPCTKKNTCFMLWGSLNSLLTYSILMWLILMWKYFKNINKINYCGFSLL